MSDPRLQRDYSGKELTELAVKNGVEGTVLVQVDQTEEETLWLLDQAEAFPIIKGVVGWVDLLADNIHQRLAHFSSYQKLKGFRHIVQAESVDFMQRPAFQRGIGSLRNFGFSYDILIYPRHLESALNLVEMFPDQAFVVDHLAKPEIKAGIMEPWRNQMKELGQFANVFCKLSGMITEADHAKWNYQQLVPYMDVVLEAFGTERIMFGSDWPVCRLAGEYEEVLDIAQRYVAGLSADQQRRILYENAKKFYNL